ncbi:Zwei Ig domain protein zig-8 [Anthophora plagiata]
MTGWRMRPTASAFGVIAIVSVMITATPSGADNGAIEPIINHPEIDEEERLLPQDERVTNQFITDDLTSVTILTHVNDTINEIPVTKDSQLIHTNHENITSITLINEQSIIEVQRDQSDLLSIAAAPNDVHELEHDPLGSEARPMVRNNPESKAQQASKDFVASTRPNRAEISSSTGHWEIQLTDPRGEEQLDGVQVDEEVLPNVVEHPNDPIDVSNIDKLRREDSIVFTISSIHETIVTETRQIEQKTVEDIRAISFQVPAVEVSKNVDRHQYGNEQERNVVESRKDHSRPVNNLLLASGKSTKAFYEIKPSIKTEMEGDQEGFSSTQRTLNGRKFVLPSVDSAFGKFGPYFEDGGQEMNITARIGSTMLLDCKIGMLGDKKVTWLQQPSKDLFRLLTVGMTTYSRDQRISLKFRYPSNWRLQIRYATPRDSGLYKCQVATHPPLVKTINVIVTAPVLTITDDSGRVVPKERHLKAGSALKLRCEARDIIESLNESVTWTRGGETLTEDVSENRTMEVLAGKEVLVIVSTLIVERATPRHAGNYSCSVSDKVKTTIAVHVLNGELPAAVHDGNGVSRAFLNLWLIHLTMSYVFSR